MNQDDSAPKKLDIEPAIKFLKGVYEDAFKELKKDGFARYRVICVALIVYATTHVDFNPGEKTKLYSNQFGAVSLKEPLTKRRGEIYRKYVTAAGLFQELGEPELEEVLKEVFGSNK